MLRFQIADDVAISRIAYGMWRIAADADTSPRHVQAKIEACLAQGITSVDQADIYGDYQAEEILGAALASAPGLRDRIEIVTKCGIVAPIGRHAGARIKHYDTSAAHITASVEASLRAMQTDRIDLLLIHRPNPMMDVVDTGRALDDLVASGKVRAVGVSNFRPFDVELLADNMTQPLVANQIEISLAALEPFTNGDLAFIQRAGMLPMAWSPLAGGSLLAGGRPALIAALREMAEAKDTDIAALAVAWLLAHPAGIVPVMGTNTLDRIATLDQAPRIELDLEDWFILYAAALGRDVP
ncbi:aldo/keto reductase [Paracoccus xiamenensis]|uniref:aldo/keto reductase n=1 Tax=Paracoccus xiamenensis TaxID=2714901 RepID=UPI001407AB85|nr:aldo/keto reductase [Paracoccus xiamenensis]NHF72132.1 oxidoreductase [Paracoccus xiamenensis]